MADFLVSGANYIYQPVSQYQLRSENDITKATIAEDQDRLEQAHNNLVVDSAAATLGAAILEPEIGLEAAGLFAFGFAVLAAFNASDVTALEKRIDAEHAYLESQAKMVERLTIAGDGMSVETQPMWKKDP